MLEVVFSESAAGSLAAAMGKKAGGQGQAGAFAQENRGTKTAALAGSRADICSFPLYLGFGAIDEAGIGPLRDQAIAALMGAYPAEEHRPRRHFCRRPAHPWKNC